jgi:hypothetical protein
LALALTLGVLGSFAPAMAAAPDDPVRARYATDFSSALSGYEQLGQQASALAEVGLEPLDAEWQTEMKATDRFLVPLERVFFPMMNRPWTRESAVFANLQGARMWLWSIHDGLSDGAAGVPTIDIRGGKVREELLENFDAYLAKARSLLDNGEFKGSYFSDTLSPVLADYCTYPEDGKRHRPDFDDPRLFDDVKAAPVGVESSI